ncbi:MAG: methyltransferase domain-containing protein [Candidatus Micrarchaeota archaeon]|nr:methyltransferase domain-containing protein [Candidatus Micrarchaeota archaeon]
MEKIYREAKSCRSCSGTILKEILNLGNQYVISFPSRPSSEGYSGPIEIVRCDNCGLVQLKHTFDRNILYKNYWYQSGISKMMVSALRDVVLSAQKIVALQPGDVVVDIASNDNTLLRQYDREDIMRIGIDPSDVAGMQKDKNIKVVNDYFSAENFAMVAGNKKAKIITCCAMFYDLDDPNSFVTDVRKCLDKNGLFVIQMNYLAETMKNFTYDDFCHEHIEFYSLKALEFVLNKNGCEVFDVITNDVNGGSIRVYIRHSGSELKVEGGEERVKRMRKWEEQYDNEVAYANLRNMLLKNKAEILNFIREEMGKGKKFMLDGASTRGYAQVQWLGITKEMMPYAYDKNPRKYGLYYGTTGIRIISMQEMLKFKPDYLYVLPYHFLPQLMEEAKELRAKGTKLFVGIPQFKVVQ